MKDKPSKAKIDVNVPHHQSYSFITLWNPAFSPPVADRQITYSTYTFSLRREMAQSQSGDDASGALQKATQYTSLNYYKPPSTRYLPTTEAYNLWAEHYDHDGNFLQALDSLELQTLFPRLMDLVRERRSSDLKLLDLGCGTGRNTVLLHGMAQELGGSIVAVDASEGMLAVAKQRIEKLQVGSGEAVQVQFGVLDLLANEPPMGLVRGADVVVSTLVLEHIPCDVFFDKVTAMLKPGGLLLLTNMHSHMGSISQAGFVDPATGEKIRPTSYAHTLQEVLDQAKQFGLAPLGDIKETAVDETLVEKLGPRSRKWVGITCWFGGVFRRTGIVARDG